MVKHGKKFKSLVKTARTNDINSAIKHAETLKRINARKLLSRKRRFEVSSGEVEPLSVSGLKRTPFGKRAVESSPINKFARRISGKGKTADKADLRRIFGLSSGKKFKRVKR